MTKMAAMPIYGKNPLEIFFSRTDWLISRKLGMDHRGLQPIIVYSNDDPQVTFDLFYGKVKFGYLGFSMGKSENCGFFQKLLQPVT